VGENHNQACPLSLATPSPPVMTPCCCSIVRATAWRSSCGPANVHSAEGWEELLVPEIECQQQRGKAVAFRADAAFANANGSKRGGLLYTSVGREAKMEISAQIPTLGRRRGAPHRGLSTIKSYLLRTQKYCYSIAATDASLVSLHLERRSP